MGQMYAKEKNWVKVISHLKKTLLMRPEHDSAAQCMFLIGYASFMEEELEEAVLWLRRIRKEFPESEIIGEATYWTAMALMFDGNYKDAAPDFDIVLDQFGSTVFAEDAAFRRAVCDYGMALYDESDAKLGAFIKNYPKSSLVSEATMMRGDIAGAVGRSDDAVMYYQQAMKDENINIEFYNHCAFHAGQILMDDKKLDEAISHYKLYISNKREGLNIPQAAYWVGVSLWNKGEQLGALRYYQQIVEEYGKIPNAVGVDMILDEWIGRIKRSTTEDAKAAWSGLKLSLDNAIASKNKTLELRLKRVMLFGDKNVSASDWQRIENEFLSEKNIQYASPAVLQKMLDLGVEKKRDKFAEKVAHYIIDKYTETDYALDARMVLADAAIKKARATKNVSESSRLYDEAIMHLGVVREVFATSGEAGKALILLGQLYIEQGKFKEADECYKSVLGVKGWRNLWPEALYGCGESSFGQRKYDVASAYYERIYLMYSHYREWAAKAYLRRAECLHKLYQDGKALEVIAEMKKDPNMQGMPELKKADKLAVTLGGNK
jgi:TolA-binding protein